MCSVAGTHCAWWSPWGSDMVGVCHFKIIASLAVEQWTTCLGWTVKEVEMKRASLHHVWADHLRQGRFSGYRYLGIFNFHLEHHRHLNCGRLCSVALITILRGQFGQSWWSSPAPLFSRLHRCPSSLCTAPHNDTVPPYAVGTQPGGSHHECDREPIKLSTPNGR